MNTITSPINRDPGNGRTSEEEIQESISPYPHEVNTAEGGEFLDDAIRMKNQLLGETDLKENE